MRKVGLLCFILSILLPEAAAQTRDIYEVPFPKPLRSACDTVSVFIIGDVMMHSRQMDFDHRRFLSEIAPRMREADICVANMEFSLAGPPYTGYPQFSCPEYFPEYVATDCGADVLLTANNHVLDYGGKGLSRTLDFYDHLRDSLGVLHTGAAADSASKAATYPLFISRKGIRIALVNFTYGSNIGPGAAWPDVNRMRRKDVHAAFERARDNGADFIVALPHWGTEYQLQPDATQREWAEWLVSEGADVIVGAHPHVVQDTTHINGVPVIYSLGNAVSNMSVTNSRLELAATLRFTVNRSSGEKKMLEPQLDFMWCTLPEKLTDSYSTIFIKEWANRRDDWLIQSDYDNMVETLDRVKAATGIRD